MITDNTGFHMDAIISYLTSHPFFYSLATKDILTFSSATRIESYQPGAHIMRQGEEGDSLIIIMDGHVLVVKEDEDGAQNIIAQRGSGEILGEMSVLNETIRMASIKALDQVRVLRIAGKAYRDLVERFPDLQKKTARLITQRSALQDFYESPFEADLRKKAMELPFEMDPSLPYLLFQLNDAAGGPDQREHCKEVAFLAREISRILCPGTSEHIYWAGLLHEIGKISLEEEEAQKCRKKEFLLGEEREHVNAVYQNVLDILEPDETLSKQIYFIKYLDKENYREMPLEAQVLKVANDYIEMIDKKYEGLPEEHAIQILKSGSDSLYNPRILKALEEVLDKFHGLRLNSQLNFIRMLNLALDAKDHVTLEHSKATVAVALILGKKIGLNREQLEELKLGCEFQNVGMIYVPEEILNAPRKLTDEEFEIIKRHPDASAKFFQHIRGMEHLCSFILHHHERFDGKGYPERLSGDQIPLHSRILRVSDVYCALRKSRIYRQNSKGEAIVYKPMMALTIMGQMQPGAFDPDLLAVFKDVLRRGELKGYSEEL